MKKLLVLPSVLALMIGFTPAFAKTEIHNAKDCISGIADHFILVKIGGHDGMYVRELQLSACNLRDRNMSDVVHFLDNHPETYFVDLSDNYIGVQGAAMIARTTTPIYGLYLDNNNLSDDGAAEIANVTSANLSTITLENNQIGDAGASALSRLNVRLMELSNNNISDAGAAALAKNSAIEDLRLRQNDIGDDGAIALAKSTTLDSLIISYNHIGASGLNALRKNKYFHTLITEGNDG